MELNANHNVENSDEDDNDANTNGDNVDDDCDDDGYDCDDEGDDGDYVDDDKDSPSPFSFFSPFPSRGFPSLSVLFRLCIFFIFARWF